MLEIKGLTKFFGGLGAVVDLNLMINKAEFVGLIGPNGAGKTTAFNLVTGFLRPNNGKVIFEGKNVTGKKPHYIAESGLVRTFQSTILFKDFTVLENIMTACHLRPKFNFWAATLHTPPSRKKQREVLAQALEIVQFLGLDAVKDRPARSLPHGHMRILGIAMALAVEPKLLLLDEPLSGMNAEEVSNAMTLIERIWQRGVAILLIEHNMRVAMSLCQRIVVLNFGRKIAEGSPEQIQANIDVIQAYLGDSTHVTSVK